MEKMEKMYKGVIIPDISQTEEKKEEEIRKRVTEGLKLKSKKLNAEIKILEKANKKAEMMERICFMNLLMLDVAMVGFAIVVFKFLFMR